MSKRFIHSINYMRGLCMLGVIAIHVGSVAIVNPSPNLGLVAILEILSRFPCRPFSSCRLSACSTVSPWTSLSSIRTTCGAACGRSSSPIWLGPCSTWSTYRSSATTSVSSSLTPFPHLVVRPGHVSYLLPGHPLVVLLPHAPVAAAPALHG